MTPLYPPTARPHLLRLGAHICRRGMLPDLRIVADIRRGLKARDLDESIYRTRESIEESWSTAHGRLSGFPGFFNRSARKSYKRLEAVLDYRDKRKAPWGIIPTPSAAVLPFPDLGAR